MRITNVRAVQPVAANSPPDWRTSLGQILVAVDTDSGLTGYGVGGGGFAGIHVVRTVLRDVLLNQDPDQIDDLWQTMYQSTLAFGRKGLAIMAISGVDLALWDLRGRASSQSVAALLGSPNPGPIPTYCTVWNELDAHLADEHQAFKLHLERPQGEAGIDAMYESVATVRRKIGDQRGLMVDAWMKWDVDMTLRIGERLSDLDVGWIEEPLSPDDWNGYEELRERCPIPIAGGEHEFTSIGFEGIIARKLHTILQPDVCWCGGLTELIRIYERAQTAGIRVCPHRGAEIWSLHAIAALDRDPLAESGRPWMTWVKGQPSIVNGLIEVTDGPGFGIEIDESNLPVMNYDEWSEN